MITYIPEVLGIIEKWLVNNGGYMSPTKEDILTAICEGVDDALQFGLIRQKTDGGYLLNKNVE